MLAGIYCWIPMCLHFIAHSVLEAYIKDWKKTYAPNAVRLSDLYYVRKTKVEPPLGISIS